MDALEPRNECREIVLLPGSNRLYPVMNDVIISMAAIWFTTSAYVDRVFKPIGPSEGIGLGGAGLDFDILVRFADPFHRAMNNDAPGPLRMGILPAGKLTEPPETQSGPRETYGFQTVFSNLGTAAFIRYFEPHAEWLKREFGLKTNKDFKGVWKFAWQVRNTCAHSGRITLSDANVDVEWRGFRINKDGDGKKFIDQEFFLAHLLLLMFDLDLALDAYGCPTDLIEL